jgi:endoglucanase
MTRASGMTRRQLLASAGVGAAGLLAATSGCDGPLPRPRPLAVKGSPGSPYLRGVNSYTLNYAASDGRFVGEAPASYRFLAARGHRLVRLPFEWGYIQPQLGRPLSGRFVAAVESEVAAIAHAGMKVVLDVHSSGRHPLAHRALRHFGAGISQAQFQDLWVRLSDRFGGDPRIYAYDLMNEPDGFSDQVWQSFSQSAVDVLRAHGDNALLWIEGTAYSMPNDWREHQPMPWIEDPVDNHAYSAHAYPGLTSYHPQRHPQANDERDFLVGLRDFLDWLNEFGRRGSVGEVGWPSRRFVGATGAAQWNRLGDAWYAMADAGGLDVTYFGASSAYDNWLWAYDAPHNRFPVPGLQRAESQSAVIEAHLAAGQRSMVRQHQGGR